MLKHKTITFLEKWLCSYIRLLIFLLSHFLSSRPEVFCKKDVLRNFAEFTGKRLCQSLFYNKNTPSLVLNVLKKLLLSFLNFTFP